MKRLLFALALAITCVMGVSVYAATTTPVAGVVRMTATGDTVTVGNQLTYGAKVVGVKVNPVAGGKYYRLRKGSTSSGAIVYETNSGATTSTMSLDSVNFTVPSDGLYFETNDTGANLTIFSGQ